MQINKHILNPINQPLITQLINYHTIPMTISIIGGGGKTHLSFWLANLCKQLGRRVCVTTTTKMFLPDPSEYDHIYPLERITADKPTLDPSVSFIYQQIRQTTKVQGLSVGQLQQLHHSGIFEVLIVEADGARHRPIKAPAGHEPCIPKCSDMVIAVTGSEAIFAPANPSNIHRWPEFSALTGCLPQMEIGYPILKALLAEPQGMFKGAPEHAQKIWVINKYDLSPRPEALAQLASQLLATQSQLTSIWLTQLNDGSPLKQMLVNK